MMTAEKFSSHCIFCTNQCPSSFTIINGKPVKLKIENETESKPFLSSNFDPGAPDDSSIESHLRVIFILRKILDIEVTKFSKFLGKCEGEFHPGLWISLCSSCDQLVGEFWEKLKEIGKLERRLKGIKSQLAGFVQDTLAFNGNGAGENLVWNEIRKNAAAGTGSANNFEEESNIERAMVATPQSEDRFADDDDEHRFTESDEEEPLIKVELMDNKKYENEEEADDPTYQPDPLSDPNLQAKRRAKKGSTEKFGCSQCSKLFDDEERLEAHYKNYHTTLPCNSCDKTFTSLKLLKDHEKRVHTHGSFPCPICSKVFASRFKLWRHKRYTHEKGGYLCSTCGKSFKSQSSHLYHVNTAHNPAPISSHHKNNVERHVGFNNSDKGKPKSATCSKCGKSFSSSRAVTRHVRDVHGDERYSCSECNVVVKSKQQLNVHMKAVHNPETHICEICRRSFTAARYLNQHVTRNHSTPAQKESWSKCPNCEKPFQHSYYLKRHLILSSCRLGKCEETHAAAEQE